LPNVLLDGGGDIIAVCAAFESLVGLDSDALIGRPFARACAPPDRSAAVEKIVSEALAGRTSSGQLPVRCTDTTGDLLLSVEFRVMNVGRSRGVMITVHDWSRDGADTPRLGDMTYAVSLRRFGVLRWVNRADNDSNCLDLVGKQCFKALFERESPCEGCPLRPTTAGRLASVVAGPPSSGRRPYLTVASRVDSATAVVSATAIDRALLRRTLHIEAERCAREAGLTDREQQVFDLVLQGLSVSEIGAALRIATSTAKFHQSNALRKLDVESRADLYHRLF
jgi:PAS domain S-box-containing protein